MLRLEGKRIFIIEDIPSNYAVMKLLLEKNGAATWFDRWGNLAIERIRSFLPVDLIITDLNFPDNVSGYDLFTQIRAIPDLSKIPIVAVSATDPADAIPRTRGMGFNGFIVKPIEYDLFIPQIVSLLNGEPVWDAG
jgi:two-component system cell cycle response regulator DivK